MFGTHYRADVSTEIDARYLLSDGTYLYVYLATMPASAEWSSATVAFTVPSNAISITIFHVLSSVGNLSMDDVSLELQEVPPPPQNTQSLISNFDVEAGVNAPSGWSKGGWGSSVANYVYPVSGFNSARASRVELSSWTSGDIKWIHPAVSVTGDVKYFFNDDYKSNVTSNLTLQYKLNDGSYSYVWLGDLPAVNEWSTSNIFSFVAPPNAIEVTIFHLINSVGYLETDNYILTTDSIVPPPPPPDPDNLIFNGDLNVEKLNEPQIPNGWKGDSWGSINVDFTYPIINTSDGTKATMVKINSISSGDAKWSHSPVNILPNKTYKFSVNYRSNIASEITLQYLHNNGSYSYVWVNAPPASANWTTVDYSFTTPADVVELTVFHLISAVGWLETDNYSLINQKDATFSEPMVTLMFDDGLKSIYDNGIPILDSAGIKSTQAIVSGYVTYEGYVNVNEILNMHNNGHEIASHSRTHAHLTQLDQAGLDSEIIGSRDDLLAMGLSSVTTLVYPYGEYNDTVKQFVANSGYYIGARSVDEGFNYTNSDPFVLMDWHIEADTTVQEITDAIDLAIASNSWLILELHAIDHSGDQYSATPETLQAIVNYIVGTGVRTVTLHQGLELLNN